MLFRSLVAALIRGSAQKRRALGLLAQEREGLELKVAERTADLESANARLSAEVGERARAEEGQRSAARENALLLKELQHRVKNSMAMISGLAGLEAGRTRNPEARESLAALESRVAVLAALYDLLFANGSTGAVDLSAYLGKVAAAAAESVGADARGVVVECSLEPVRIDMKRAVPLGLAVNELVTDSLKHAFAGRASGRIVVSLEREGGSIRLEVRDDGVGLPAEPDADGAGFGIELVEMLTRQLRGTLTIGASPEGGASFAIAMSDRGDPA